nr:hypothetical protein [Tanacetum cinerariifolium]
MENLIQDNLAIKERLEKHGSRLYNLENLNIPQKVSKAVDEIVTDAVDWAMQGPLQARFSDLPAVDIKEILQQLMFKDNSYEAHDDHKNLYEYSNQLLVDLEEARMKKRMKPNLPRTPSDGAPSSSKSSALTPQSMAWTTSDTRYESVGFAATYETSPIDYLTNDYSILDEQVHMSDDEDIVNDHLPKADMRKECGNHLLKKIDQQLLNLLGPSLFPMCQMLRTTRLLHLDYLSYGNKGSMLALSISKMKAARYPNLGIELLVQEQMWIDERSQKTHADSQCRQSKAFSRYGYDYLSEIILLRDDFQEHKIADKDFNNLYPSEFEDLNLLLLKGWDAKCFKFKHDYTIIESPRAVVFPININERKIMYSGITEL